MSPVRVKEEISRLRDDISHDMSMVALLVARDRRKITRKNLGMDMGGGD